MNATTSKRLATILEFTKRKPGIGKTAMMKFIYFLQEIHHCSLKYDYEIYTYGPYSHAVIEDIDLANHYNLIKMNIILYNKAYGYSLEPVECVENKISIDKRFVELNKKSIDNIMFHFENKSAKELELLSTIIYLNNLYKNKSNSFPNKEFFENVRDIKPHFKLDEIEKNYLNLKSINYLI